MRTRYTLAAWAAAALVSACGGGGDATGTSGGTGSTNAQPTAQAGNPQSVVSGTTVTLNGSASTDTNGDRLTYLWTLVSKPSGSAATLSSSTAVTPTVATDVAGSYVFSLVVNDGQMSSAASTVNVTAAIANAAPVANAGTAQNVTTGTLVTLDGSASSDANGDALTYAWVLTSQPFGNTAAFASANSARPTFTADIAGSYVATLTVSDGTLSSSAVPVTVVATVANAAPVANAGAAQSVSTGTLVTLDGSVSSDANGDPLTYNWTLTSKPAGSAAILNSPTSARPTFSADRAGTYVASLIVTDGRLSSVSRTVTVTAAVANAAPVANAGAAQNVTAGSLITLDGSASSDANGDPLTYNWVLAGKPAGSAAVLSSTTATRPTFTADIAGTYVSSLVVSDGRLSSQSSNMTVTATTVNAAPVANAGSAQSVVTGTSVSLDGSASSDANGDSLTFAWTLTGRPAGSSASLSGANAARPTFTVDIAGTYVASLLVNDGRLNSSIATATITAAAANAAPVANAGQAQSVVTTTTVTLDGAGSSDANGDPLTYLWSFRSRPAGSAATLLNSTSSRPTFVADAIGSYVLTLVVNDGRLNSSAAVVTVTATQANAAPVANAGPAQSVVAGSTVTLSGVNSTDANGDTLSYVWSLATRPAGSNTVLSNANSVSPFFVADAAGVYVASLVVSDGRLNSAAAPVTVTATVANAAPVANAGPAQSAYLGDLVRLDGSASSDANGDSLTYAWSVRSYPGFFAPTVSGASTVGPSFTARDAGSYVFSLVVSDGRLTSGAATVTVTVANGVGPTPAGSGLIVQSVLNFWTLDEATMTKRVDFSCGQGLQAIDRRPDGVIVGTTPSQLIEVNPVSGVCSARGNTPEWIRGVAVSPQGQLVGVSLSQVVTPSGPAHRLHRLTNAGASQSSVLLSGASTYVQAIDFAADGQLYGMGITSGGSNWSIVRIDVDTGVTTVAFAMPRAPTLGDIDIDATGILRTVIDGTLYKFNISTGAQVSTVGVTNFPLGNSFAPIVYVP